MLTEPRTRRASGGYARQMGLADEVRRERNQRAAAAKSAADAHIGEIERCWEATLQAIDTAAPEVVRTCRDLEYPKTGWLVRGWVFSLGHPTTDLKVLFYPNGSWRFVASRGSSCRRRLDRKNNQCVIWCGSNHSAVKKWRESKRTLTPDDILENVKVALVLQTQIFHLHRPRTF